MNQASNRNGVKANPPVQGRIAGEMHRRERRNRWRRHRNRVCWQPDPPCRPAEADMPTDIRIADVTYDTEEYRYRTPIKFGGVAVDRATILNVRVVVRTADGRLVPGAG